MDVQHVLCAFRERAGFLNQQLLHDEAGWVRYLKICRLRQGNALIRTDGDLPWIDQKYVQVPEFLSRNPRFRDRCIRRAAPLYATSLQRRQKLCIESRIVIAQRVASYWRLMRT